MKLCVFVVLLLLEYLILCQCMCDDVISVHYFLAYVWCVASDSTI